jgi:hypothetical protein
MATTSQREVNFTTGEGLILEDLQNMQRYLKSIVMDQGFGGTAKLYSPGESGIPPFYGRSSPGTFGDVINYCLVSDGGTAFMWPTGGARQITTEPGMIYQWVDGYAPDGYNCNLLGYQLGEGELGTTFAANSSGNPRIDALCVKLSYSTVDSETRDFQDATTGDTTSTSTLKQRITVLTSSVVQGTPGATPARPTIPDGYVAYCYCYLSNGQGALTAPNIWDNRLPMRMGSIRTYAHAGTTTNAWAVSSNGFTFNSGAGNGYLPCPLTGNARILKVRIFGKYQASTDLTAKLKAGTLQNSTGPSSGDPSFSGEVVLETPSTTISTSTVFGDKFGAHSPIWGNGSCAGVYVINSAPDLGLAVEFQNTSGTYADKITCVEWVYAY